MPHYEVELHLYGWQTIGVEAGSAEEAEEKAISRVDYKGYTTVEISGVYEQPEGQEESN